eukprot:TRINITY_DN1839_c0_g1_i3.p2 TRINITY_DN1839_c0_g1~~TRINITY_DN1839_c0_g1_i3.p2  ORF type:complete len:138 (+),score=31.15 TRINITY_DN1839_c0_g1_i3:181-594(+)
MIHDFLCNRSYWAAGIPRDTVERAIRGSMPFGLYASRKDGDNAEVERQIAFARVITDRATFAYICDLFVLEGYRGRGLGKQLVASIVAHPDLQGLRRWMLATRDAHSLYAQYGFTPLGNPDRLMESVRFDVYKSTGA